EHARAREQRGIYFERWVFGGGADQGDSTVLDGVQERVLLRLVEAMYFVDEEYGAFAVTHFCFRLLNCIAQVFHAGEDGGQCDEAQAAVFGEQPGESCLAGAWRAPKDQRRQRAAAVDELAQDASFADEMFLADKLRQRSRAHAFGEWSAVE